jgi:hypothetical protein
MTNMRRMKGWRRAFVVLAFALAMSAAACSPGPQRSSISGDGCGPGMCLVPLRTSSKPGDGPCPLMAILGVMVRDPTYGLGLRNEAGRTVGVIWPFGYSARRDEVGTILFNPRGQALAREGDSVRMAGWIDSGDHVAHPCDAPELEVIGAGAVFPTD